ncbi:hypothetical protein THRCLA_04443 [Thraustotheca clavata]|uniref:Uncharacterized protein n=1 Tax=Thraustotheca clavata TaxID=74557 RepID=A0A1V9ZZ66_9STRA|nr:hypothetical protein THRCLA_04443 [Thraustotheca clavata]
MGCCFSKDDDGGFEAKEKLLPKGNADATRDLPLPGGGYKSPDVMVQTRSIPKPAPTVLPTQPQKEAFKPASPVPKPKEVPSMSSEQKVASPKAELPAKEPWKINETYEAPAEVAPKQSPSSSNSPKSKQVALDAPVHTPLQPEPSPPKTIVESAPSSLTRKKSLPVEYAEEKQLSPVAQSTSDKAPSPVARKSSLKDVQPASPTTEAPNDLKDSWTKVDSEVSPISRKNSTKEDISSRKDSDMTSSSSRKNSDSVVSRKSSLRSSDAKDEEDNGEEDATEENTYISILIQKSQTIMLYTMGRRHHDAMGLTRGHAGGIAMGAVFGMFWMRMMLAFSYIETCFFMILPVAFSMIVVAEQRSFGPYFDKALFKLQMSVSIAMASPVFSRKLSIPHVSLPDEVIEEPQLPSASSSPTGSPSSKPLVYRKSSAVSNTADLIATAQSSLFSGVGIDLKDHTISSVGGQSKPIYLQEVNSGYFVKVTEGRVRLTPRPDDSCLFIWVQGKTHHWGLLSLSSQKYLGQNIVSTMVVASRKLAGWEAFRVVQNADIPFFENNASCPIHLILCSARFGRGMWLSSRMKEGERILSLTRNFSSALCVKYATDLSAFKKSDNDPRPSRSSSASSSPVRQSFVGDSALQLSWLSSTSSPFFQSTSFATIMTQTLENLSLSTLSNSLVDAYDVMIPETINSWTGHPTFGNVRVVNYAVSPGTVDEYHACRLDNDVLSFKIRMQFNGFALGDNFTLEVEYLLSNSSVEGKGVTISCLKAVHWSKQTLFQRHIDTASRAAVLGSAQQLASLLVSRNHSSKVLWNLPTLFFCNIQQQFDRNQVEHVNLLEPISVPWKGPTFFENPTIQMVYSSLWPITPTQYYDWFVSDSSAFFRKVHEECHNVNVDMSPWTYHPTLGHLRKQTFTMPIEGLIGYMTTTVREYQWNTMDDGQLLRYGSKIFVGDLPDGQAFSVEVHYDVHLDVPTQTQCRLTCSSAIQWAHASKYKTSIEEAVKKALTETNERILNLVKSHIHEIEDVRDITWLPSQDERTANTVVGYKKYIQSSSFLLAIMGDHVNIKQVNGATHRVDIDIATATVHELKLKVQELLHCPPEAQRLIFQGRVLDDKATLTSYGLNSELIVHLAINTKLMASTPAAPSPAAPSIPTPSTPSVQPASSSQQHPIAAHLPLLKQTTAGITALTTIKKMAENIVNHPTEEKYRKIRLSNEALKRKVLDVPHGLACVQAMGFASGVEEGFLVLVPSAANWDQLIAAKRLIDAASIAPASPFTPSFTPSSAPGIDPLQNMQSMLQNPMFANMLQQDPNIQQMAQSNPMLRQALSNPALLQQSLSAIQNNPMMREQLNQMMANPQLAQQMMSNPLLAQQMMQQPFQQQNNPFQQPNNPFQQPNNPFQQPNTPFPSSESSVNNPFAASTSRPASVPSTTPAAPSNSSSTTTEEDEIAEAIARSLREIEIQCCFCTMTTSEVVMLATIGIASLLVLLRALFGPLWGELERNKSSAHLLGGRNSLLKWKQRIGKGVDKRVWKDVETLGEHVLDGYITVKKGASSKVWKKRWVMLDAYARVKCFSNAEAARRTSAPKHQFTVQQVQIELNRQYTLELRNTLGGTYYFQFEDDSTMNKWLLVLQTRAVQSTITGRIDPMDVHHEDHILAPKMLHSLKVIIDNYVVSTLKDTSMRQYFLVAKFKSELHDHSNVPVGQTNQQRVSESTKSVVWNEPLTWSFPDHECSACDECQSLGITGMFGGLPDILVIHVHEVTMRVKTTKIGRVTISLKELFGPSGVLKSSVEAKWPILSTTQKNQPKESILGTLNVKLEYSTERAVSESEEETIVPFLTSEPKDLELVGEFDLPTSITTFKEFVDTYYPSSDSLPPEGELSANPVWNTYWKDRGDSEIMMEAWEPSSSHGGCVRKVTFRSLTHAPIGPSSTMTTNTWHMSGYMPPGCGIEVPEGDELKLCVRVQLHDIPYGDCFTVEHVTEYEKTASGQLHVKIYLAIPFSKGCMFKSKIITQTKSTVAESYELFYRLLNELHGKSDDAPKENSVPEPHRLARLCSIIDEQVALEEIFENQRVHIFGKWEPNHLWPTDRPRFSNRNGDKEMSFDAVNPPNGWIWTSEWKVDTKYTDCDEEGWSYATDFPRFKSHLARGKSNAKKGGNSVRRRRWIRTMCVIPDN